MHLYPKVMAVEGAGKLCSAISSLEKVECSLLRGLHYLESPILSSADSIEHILVGPLLQLEGPRQQHSSQRFVSQNTLLNRQKSHLGFRKL